MSEQPAPPTAREGCCLNLPIVLASASRVRRALLEAAGLDILVDPAAVDEAAVKESYAGEGAGPARSPRRWRS